MPDFLRSKLHFLAKLHGFVAVNCPELRNFTQLRMIMTKLFFIVQPQKCHRVQLFHFFKQVDILFYHSLKCVLVGAMWYKVHEKYTAGTFFDKLCGQKTTTSCENFLMKYITKSLLFGPRIHRKSKNRGSILTRLPL